MSKETVQKYGVLVSPALAINNTVKIVERVPNLDEVKKLLGEALTKGEKNGRKNLKDHLS